PLPRRRDSLSRNGMDPRPLLWCVDFALHSRGRDCSHGLGHTLVRIARAIRQSSSVCPLHLSALALRLSNRRAYLLYGLPLVCARGLRESPPIACFNAVFRQLTADFPQKKQLCRAGKLSYVVIHKTHARPHHTPSPTN